MTDEDGNQAATLEETETAQPANIIVGCERQAVLSRRMSIEEARAWVEQEIQFWTHLQLTEGQEEINGRDIRVNDIGSAYVKHLNLILTEREDEKFSQGLTGTLAAAEQTMFILSEGNIAAEIKELLNARQETKGMVAIGAAAYSRFLPDKIINDAYTLSNQSLIQTLIRLNPSSLAGRDMTELATLLQSSKQREAEVLAYSNRVEIDRKARTDALIKLEVLYHTKLGLEAPATYWKSVSERASSAWKIWLAFFTVVAGIPLVVAISQWSDLASQLTTFLSEAGLGGVAALSFAGLTYGWLLKHISRGFVQNLQIADDADQRRVMVMTFLGLSKDPNVEIGEGERALILNALFRPTPPSSADEGPPAGILELIRRD